MLRRSTVGTLACLLGVVALTGCTPSAPPTATPTSTAIFSSEDEALAAATDVYQQYNAAFDQALANGGEDMSGLRDLVTDEHFVELDKPGTIDSNGWHTEGSSSFSVKSVASYEADTESAAISVNLCRDLSNVRVMDSAGLDVTPETWPAVVPLKVSFASSESNPKSFLVSTVASWSAQDSC
jgi:hypothetical protein